MDALTNSGLHTVTGAAPRLELRQVRKAFGDQAVVDGIDLAVVPGECVVLLGPSGCGKTTTLRMVAGFMRPDSGEIYLDGRPASAPGVLVPTERRRLGMVFQNYAVWPHKNVADNVAYGLVVARESRERIKVRLAHLLDSVRLGGMGARFPNELSGGQQQRVALARAIATEPALLLLDEPLSNLDAALRQEMRDELKALHRKSGLTMLYVTHDQEEALVLADRVVVMNRGVIEQADSPALIYRQPRTRFVANFVGTTNLFTGRVEARDDANTRLCIRTDGGWSLWASTHRETFDALTEGDAAAVSVRPEDVRVVPTAEASAGDFPARLLSSAFLGKRHDVHLEGGGISCRADVRSLVAFSDGIAAIQIDEAAAWVVP